MSRICFLFLFLISGVWPARVSSAATFSCPIQRAAAAGPYIWLLCQRETLFVSADEGKTWQARRLPSDVNFRAIAFLDSRRGFVAGDGGTLLATEDGAETWRRVPLPTQENLTSIHFVGELGWLAGWAGVILHTRDAGMTWERQQSGVLQGLESIFFIDANHGWAAGWGGTILRTADGGRNWEEIRLSGTFWSLDSIYFRDSRHGWAVGFGGLILRSSDGGATWQRQTSPVETWLKSVVFDGRGRGWIAADDAILVTDDGGENWRLLPVEGNLFLCQVLRVKDSLWAVGQFGVVKQSAGEPSLTLLATLPAAHGESYSDN